MINVTADAIYIDDGLYTFEDVFLSISKSKYNNQAYKIGSNNYFFKFDFHIGKSSTATLQDKNKNIEIDGELFQVHQDSSFIFGEQKNKESYIGGSFSIKRPALAYGFGCNIKNKDGFTLSGNLQLYASYIDIPCFWGFFNTPEKQLVEIEDCIIKGFGRISGSNSYIKNVTCLSPQTKYGSFSTKGAIKSIEKLKVVNAIDGAYALYYNPALSGDISMSEVSVKNCQNTIYCETATNLSSLTLIDSNIDKLNILFKDKNVNVNIAYSLNFIGSNENDEIKIYDNSNNLVDSFLLKDKKKSILNYKTFNMLGDKTTNNYKLNINGKEFRLQLTQKQTINIDVLLESQQDSTNESKEEIFLLSKKEFELGDVIEFFIEKNNIENVFLKKSNYKTIAQADEIKKINTNLYYVKFITYGIGESNDDNVRWQDGPYIIELKTKNNSYFTSIYMNRVKEDVNSSNNNKPYGFFPSDPSTQFMVPQSNPTRTKIYL